MSGLAELVELVERSIEKADTSDHRRMLLGVTDLLVDLSTSLSHDDAEAFEIVIGRLVESAEEDARQAVAERVITLAEPPTKLVRRLAADTAGAVAGPILSSEVPIPDNALIRLAQSRGQVHLAAIARRATLNEGVCEAVAAKGDEPVLLTLLANTGARLSDKALSLLATRIKDESTFSEALARRPDIDPERRATLLQDRRAQKATAANSNTAQTRARAEAAVASRVKIGLDETDIVHWLENGRPMEALCALAHLSGVASQRALMAHANPKSGEFTLLVRAARLSRKTLWRYLLLSSAAESGALGTLMTLFDNTTIPEARERTKKFRINTLIFDEKT